MSIDEFPRKRSAAGVLFARHKEILIVKPTYSEKWLIPGSVVEAGESPRGAAERDCVEEIGIRPRISGLLVVDYRDSDAIHFIFEGHLEDYANININRREIERFSWESISTASELLEDHLAKRVIASIQAITLGKPVYCENGEILT